VIRGHAGFGGPHEVRVEGRLLETDRIVLNVGARVMVPDMPGLSDIYYMTHVKLFELDTVPEHLVIVAGSYIWPRVRPDVSSVWCAHHGDREVAAADSTRGRGCLRHN